MERLTKARKMQLVMEYNQRTYDTEDMNVFEDGHNVNFLTWSVVPKGPNTYQITFKTNHRHGGPNFYSFTDYYDFVEDYDGDGNPTGFYRANIVVEYGFKDILWSEAALKDQNPKEEES